jgi:hypothetical protein
MFAIILGKRVKLANRLSLFSTDPGGEPGIETFTFAVALVIVAVYEECLLRGIELTGILAQMSRRDPFSPEELRTWFRTESLGTGFSTDFPQHLLEDVAHARHRLEFIRAIRSVLHAIGAIDLRYAVSSYKPYTTAAERLVDASLEAPEVKMVALTDYDGWIETSKRRGQRKDQKTPKPRFEFKLV